MKQEESSISNLDKNAGGSFKHMQLKQSLSTTYGYDPIEDLGIQVNKNDPNDEEELLKLVGFYLRYPSTKFAELHAEALRLGNYEL